MLIRLLKLVFEGISVDIRKPCILWGLRVTINPHGQMVMGNNTTWMRKSTLDAELNPLNKISSYVAYKQAALNAIAYLQKVLYAHHFF